MLYNAGILIVQVGLMGNPTFVAYIDESGCEGFAFDSGSSRWFVLGAVVLRAQTESVTTKLTEAANLCLGRRVDQDLHFCKLSHRMRVPYVDHIGKADLKAMGVLIHKPSLMEREVFKSGYKLYFYTARYLLERISWYCRDHRTKSDAGDGSVRIIFSNRSNMQYAPLRQYMATLQQDSTTTIDWNVVKADQVSAMAHPLRRGLQIADAVASSMFSAVEGKYGDYIEDKYLSMLQSRLYSYNGCVWGYGLKLWPKEADDMRIRGDILSCIKKKGSET
jgi:hypothetical protein